MSVDKMSEEGLGVTKTFEGRRFRPYLCPAGLWTIGYGSLLYPEQARLPTSAEGMAARRAWKLSPAHDRLWSQEEVDALLVKDVARFERGVKRLVPVPLTQGQFDCLCDFAYNIGLGGLQRSTVRQAVLRGDKAAAMASLMKYNKGGGKVLAGLTKRRTMERILFLRSQQS